MTWFERLTGFVERDFSETKRRLNVIDGRLVSDATPNSYGVGRFELVNLFELRRRCRAENAPAGRLSVRNISGDARTIHQIDGFKNALIQVASQFNMLEMVSPTVSPEDGVSIYEFDATQGPACAIAAGAATIYRNYFVRVGDQIGQSAQLQLDGLAAVGDHLTEELGVAHGDLWRMQNGYALCEATGLQKIADALASSPHLADGIRRRLSIGLHWDVEVTDMARPQYVSQAFCSALPVAYSRIAPSVWAPFAATVLEAAYEATLCAAKLNAARGRSNKVLLTRLGGGAFGNRAEWIDAAMTRALEMARGYDLDVFIVSFDAPPPSMVTLASAFNERVG